MDDLELLMHVLREPPPKGDAEALRARFEGAAGLWGVWQGGPDVLFDVATRPHQRLQALCALGARLSHSPQRSPVIDSPGAVVDYVGPKLGLEAQESFWALSLDARGRALALRCVARGTLTACLVHPREVFAPALRCRAHALVVVHNHPSGDPEPSLEDRQLTARLEDAGQLLGIPLVDHVVVARGGFRSLCGAGPTTADGAPADAGHHAA